jgi:hypothetical protein
VVVTGESQRGKAAPVPSRLAADEVTGEFGPDSALKAMTGTGHASMEETNAAGTRQTSTGDRLEAHFSRRRRAGGRQWRQKSGQGAGGADSVGGAGWACGADAGPAAKPGAERRRRCGPGPDAPSTTGRESGCT